MRAKISMFFLNYIKKLKEFIKSKWSLISIFIVLLFYFLSMFIYPFFIGDWNYVQSVWHAWQSLNAGVLAFTASIIALYTVRYREEKDRKRRFAASKACLPHVLAELSKYFSMSSILFIEASKKMNDKDQSKIESKLPELPKDYPLTFKECINQASSEIGEELSYIIARLQIHHSRMESLRVQFNNSDMSYAQHNISEYIFRLAELQILINRLFDYSRSTSELKNTLLTFEEYCSCYRLWDIDIKEKEDLKYFTERNQGSRW